MASYKTPDVYVEEISKLPASVAQVETAVPAFIGYTERNTYNGKSYLNKPKKVTSIVEFEQMFGGAPPIAPTVTLDSVNNSVESVSLGNNTFYLYDSLRLFFDNGGGKCYIVSVGTYSDPGVPDIGDVDEGILGGLKALEKEDEPTILLSPDAATLSETDLASFQQQALKQAGKLMDRIALLDLRSSGDHEADVQSFRDKVGINNLKYGAAYTPWLNTAYPKTVKYRSLTLKKGATTMSFRNLTKDAAIRDYIDSLLKPSIDAVDGLGTGVTANAALINPEDSLQDKFTALYEAVETGITDYIADNAQLGAMQTAVGNLFKFVYDVITAVQTYRGTLPDPGADPTVTKFAFKLKTDIPTLGSDNAVPATGQASFIDYLKALEHADVWTFNPGFTSANARDLFNGIFGGGTVNASLNNALKGALEAADENIVAQDSASAAAAIWGAVTAWISDIGTAANSYETTFDSGLSEVSGSYKSILAEVGKSLNDCPPSGAIAGIMAYVDGTRGVWKAPANVSLASVVSPVVQINNDEQEDLNVDVNAGKSVNAIRAFTGKGTLVWGARTLAGNDNEWRYVSVRRFYNMVEESIKKSTYWAVFEPNDANTWVKVQGMISNYLTGLWRQGALAGAAPEDAFFVNVGLGTTMTPVDILEGRMNVEIGMAAVRPAEFIILKFSHKLQEA